MRLYNVSEISYVADSRGTTFKGTDERLGVKRLLRRSGSSINGYGAIRKTLDEFLDHKILAGEMVECETGRFGEYGPPWS